MTIPFLAQEISGLADPTYASGAANKRYVDTISGNLDTRIDALAGAGEVTFGIFESTDGTVHGFDAGTFAVSSAGGTTLDLSIPGYSTISSNAEWSQTWLNASGSQLTSIVASGNEYSQAYASAQIAYYTDEHVDHDETTNYVADEHIDHTSVSITAGAGLAGGGDLTATRDIAVGAGTGIEVNADDIEVLGYDTISSNAKAGSDYVASGNEYSAAYSWYDASAQKLSDYNSGWASVPADNPITHGVSSVPSNISVTPSGAVTFSYAVSSITSTTFCIAISAPGNRMVSWRAEV